MYIVNKEQMYSSDRYTTEVIGIDEAILMENAGQKMADEIVKLIPNSSSVTVFCGVGNNGGDGFVVARRLNQLGFNVNVVVVGDASRYKNSAYNNFKIYKNLGYNVFSYDSIDFSFFNVDVIVDAIFGIGFRGDISANFSDVILKINSSKAKVFSLDIPSGVYCDSNTPCNVAVKADYTLTVSFFKDSAFLYPARLNYGQIFLIDAGIVLNKSEIGSVKRLWGYSNFKNTFPKRRLNTNKSMEGKILIVGGSRNMVGALILATKSCFEAGAGLVFVATPEVVRAYVINNVFEATYIDCCEELGFLTDFNIDKNIDVLACGPGLGRKDVTRAVVKKAIGLNVPVVLDADALYFLDNELLNAIKNRKFPTVLTPHVGEMARLCNCSAEYIENNRFSISKTKAVDWGAYIVLKGPNTVISTPSGTQIVNTSGNSGLSKGGTGDVLTGIISAFMAKHKNIEHAILNAVYMHGRVSELLVAEKLETNNTVNATKLIANFSRFI